jgi:SET domain/COMPASS (Complex proteins associated with Set1p) component N
LEKKPFGHHTIVLTSKPPPSPDEIAPVTKAQPPRELTTDEVVAQACGMIIDELKTVLARDLRERVINRRVRVNIDDFRAKKRKSASHALLVPPSFHSPEVQGSSEEPTPRPKVLNIRFTKKSGVAPTLTKKRPVKDLEDDVDEQVSRASDDEGSRDASVAPALHIDRPSPTKKRKRLKPVLAPTEAVEVESEDEENDELPAEERLRAEKHKRAGDVDLEPKDSRKKRKLVKTEVPVDEVDNVLLPKVERASTVDISVFDGDAVDVHVKAEVKPAKSRAKTKSKPPPIRAPPPDPFELGLVNLNDDEELFFLREGLARRKTGLSIFSDADADLPQPPPTPRHPLLRVNHTGSARTEGYYKIPEAAKSLYLPDRNKAVVDVPASTSHLATAPAGTSSRSNRVNSRKLVQGMEQANKYLTQSGGSDASDHTLKLKFNQLRTRKKKLKFSRSPIHDWGLYAMEPISSGEMVIEYVGEVIRQQVADKREKYYERTGIGSSYLFRVDDDAVVDATKKGNLGYVIVSWVILEDNLLTLRVHDSRLINHCCTPNCTAKIITINGEKKIVIYAKTNIEPGDEITYGAFIDHGGKNVPRLTTSI